MNDKKEATRIDNHNIKNNTSEASFDTGVKSNPGIAGGKASDREKKIKRSKMKNNKTKKKNPRMSGDGDKEQGKREKQRDANPKYSCGTAKSQMKYDIPVAAEDKVTVGSREECADSRQTGEGNKQDKREKQRDANPKYSVRTAKSQLNRDIIVSLVLEVGGKHDPMDSNYPQVILTAFPELKREGANANEIERDLVAAAVFVMDTFKYIPMVP